MFAVGQRAGHPQGRLMRMSPSRIGTGEGAANWPSRLCRTVMTVVQVNPEIRSAGGPRMASRPTKTATAPEAPVSTNTRKAGSALPRQPYFDGRNFNGTHPVFEMKRLPQGGAGLNLRYFLMFLKPKGRRCGHPQPFPACDG